MTLLDLDKYTLGELAKVEELTGLSIPDLMKPGAPKMRRAGAVCFIEAKRRGEEITWAQILNWSMPQVNEFLSTVDDQADDHQAEGDESPDPKATSGKSKPKTSRSSSSRSASNPRSTGD